MSYERAAEILRDARRLLILTGAGVSTDSGVPDFRSTGGIWTKFDPEDFHYARFLDDPAGFWRLRARLMAELDLERAKPNATHEAIAQASRSDRFLGHVTQNIDGLFQRAAHDDFKLVEIHGSAANVRCLSCEAWLPYEDVRERVEAGEVPPACPECAGPMKPATVLFGEMLPEPAVLQADGWTRHADVVLVVGSSLTVYPAAAIPRTAIDRGARLLIVNDAPTPQDDDAHVVVRGRVAETVPRLLRDAGFWRIGL